MTSVRNLKRLLMICPRRRKFPQFISARAIALASARHASATLITFFINTILPYTQR
jgi:hypothetical protein